MCQSDNNHHITSGGGFSNYFKRPSWQNTAVTEYFIESSKSGNSPLVGYSLTGRGYPDVSLAGYGFLFFTGGKLASAAGSSISSCIVAGMISNINAARMRTGKGSVGWLNPAIYANAALFNDIISGNNRCCRGPRCCEEGFSAARNWDPVSGLGSVDYQKLEAVLLSLGSIKVPSNYTVSPSLIFDESIAAPSQFLPTSQHGDISHSSKPADTTACVRLPDIHASQVTYNTYTS